MAGHCSPVQEMALNYLSARRTVEKRLERQDWIRMALVASGNFDPAKVFDELDSSAEEKLQSDGAYSIRSDDDARPQDVMEIIEMLDREGLSMELLDQVASMPEEDGIWIDPRLLNEVRE